MKRMHFHIDGIVQGVGFRPFIYRLAKKFNLVGFVYNHSEGVEIEVQGNERFINNFKKSVTDEKPPLSKINNLISKEIPIIETINTFKILKSVKTQGANTLLPPDIATCDDCIRELFDSEDRRYKYPFINCMNCGPRYTIINSIPYDRKNTTMNVFPLCNDCQIEYIDPSYRRFHAEPNACEICGPSLKLLDEKGFEIQSNNKYLNSNFEIKKTIELLKEGKIVAIKSLGGFHLACDGMNDNAIKTLRERKLRLDKPFALMSFNIERIKKYCYVNECEEKLLTDPQKPIVLLKKKNSVLSSFIAPNNNYLGVMIAYNPVQLLLLKNDFLALVMTSANMKEEPICIRNEEAINRLSGIADAYLINNRDINTRVDDSISFIENKRTYFIRRARGYVPNPIDYITELKNILGLGAELKNTIAISRSNQIFVSQHLGDLKNVDSYNFFQETIKHLSLLMDLSYNIVAHDLHPDYLSTRYAKSLKEKYKLIGIQHHKAHIASCIADNCIEPDTEVIGIALDGTGFGEDNTIWGGEFFTGNLYNLKRIGRFKPIKMPGGEKAVNEPYRMVISYLIEYLNAVPEDIPFFKRNTKNIPIIKTILDKNINSPLTSSAGRLFDAVSSLLGIRDYVNYEAQAAIDLQMISEKKINVMNLVKSYPIDIFYVNNMFELDFGKFFENIIEDMRKNEDIALIGIKFHKSICEVLARICEKIREIKKINNVTLSGGVFQNRIILKYLIPLLNSKKFNVFIHKNIPCNDAGISLGQILLANYSKYDV